MKRAVAPLVDMCNRLIRTDMTLIPDDVRAYFPDVYDHVIWINEMIDTLRELLTTALEANLSLISVSQNEAMKRLAGWAAIFAVATMIAGVSGHELQVHAGARMVAGLPAGDGDHARRLRVSLLPLQALRLALSVLSVGRGGGSRR